jgi:hypothetical protein
MDKRKRKIMFQTIISWMIYIYIYIYAQSVLSMHAIDII